MLSAGLYAVRMVIYPPQSAHEVAREIHAGLHKLMGMDRQGAIASSIAIYSPLLARLKQERGADPAAHMSFWVDLLLCCEALELPPQMLPAILGELGIAMSQIQAHRLRLATPLVDKEGGLNRL